MAARNPVNVRMRDLDLIERLVRYPLSMTSGQRETARTLIRENEAAAALSTFLGEFYDRVDRLPEPASPALEAFIDAVVSPDSTHCRAEEPNVPSAGT